MEKTKGLAASIFEFDDYRSFLTSYVERRRNDDSDWSYGVWARRLKLSSVSAISMVVSGQRTPGPKMVKSLSKYFSFNTREREYFEDLVRLQKSRKDLPVLSAVAERLRKSRPDFKFSILGLEEYETISHWVNYAIREMTQFKEFENDENWIHRKLIFQVSPAKIRKSISNLILLGQLKKHKRGQKETLRTTENYVSTTDDIASPAIKKFHQQVLELANQALDKIEVKKREFGSLTLAFDSRHTIAAKEKIRAFQDEFAKEFGEDKSADQVCQLNIQFYPLTQRHNSNGDIK